MNKENALAIFGKYITNNIIPDSTGQLNDVAIMEIGNEQTIDVDFFVSIFGEAEVTYDSLCAIDAGEKGYKDFFDLCKTEGLLV